MHHAGPDAAAFARWWRSRAGACDRPSRSRRALGREAARAAPVTRHTRPLADYRAAELEHMRLNFYGFDPSYHIARHRFVHRTPHAWTPLHLAGTGTRARPRREPRSACNGSRRQTLPRRLRRLPRARCAWRMGGRVQGVGFRPFVFRLAHLYRALRLGAQLAAARWRSTHKDRRSGCSSSQRRYCRARRSASRGAPARGAAGAARAAASGFRILASTSRGEELHVHVPLDLFTCDECLRRTARPARRGATAIRSSTARNAGRAIR